MKRLVLILALPLAACGPNYAERHAAYMAKCTPHFTPAQCEIFFEIKEEARSAKANAAAASAMSAAGVGLAAGRH